MPDLDLPVNRQRREPKRLKRHDGLKNDDRPALIPPFHHDPGWQCQEQSWQGSSKADQYQIERAAQTAASVSGVREIDNRLVTSAGQQGAEQPEA